MKKINIAIDGFSACGKSTTAKAMARELGYTYVDSGAMYRAVTYYFMENNVALTNPKSIQKALENINITFVLNSTTGECDTFLNGLRVEEEIREMPVTERVSEVSTISSIRSVMVAQQRKMAKRNGVVMDGRDIGTVVMPDAELKIFMIADPDVRAERRQKELFDKNQLVDFEVVKNNLAKRDKIDSTREDSPLKQASDAEIIDTTYMTTDEQLEYALNLVMGRMYLNSQQETETR